MRIFKKEAAWYIKYEDEGRNMVSYLDKGDGPTEAKLVHGHDFKARIEPARKRDNVPPVAALSSSKKYLEKTSPASLVMSS